MATLQEQLADAQQAYHDLQVGKNVWLAKDQSGEEVRYTPANRNELLAYIGELQNQIAAAAGVCSPIIGPMRVFF